MAFFEQAITVLQTLVIALGAGLGIWGVINLLEGYGNDNPGSKSQGMTMQEVVDLLRDEHGWSDSVSNLSNKLQRESLRYVEAVQLADALGFEIVWQRRK